MDRFIQASGRSLLALTLLCSLSAGQDHASQAPPPDHPPLSEADKGPWGQASNGLRARIVYAKPISQAWESSNTHHWFQLWTEVQNTGSDDAFLHLGIWKTGGAIVEDGEGYDTVLIDQDGEEINAST